MKKLFISLFFFSTILSVVPLLETKAGILDPWYACYKVQGGSLKKCIGPIPGSKYDCLVYQYKIPLGATWIGCEQ